jgi:heat-inducible transcriptional repressor
MITSGGAVKTKKVKLYDPVTSDTLKRLTALMNEYLCGLSADMITLPIIMEMESAMGEYSYLVNPAVKSVYEVMNELDGGEMKYSGINQLLKYPEYSDTRQFGELLGTLENQDEILDLVSRADSDSINVLIGSESPVEVMNNSSLVFKPIKKNGRTIGVIGVLGPRRMNYKQVLEAIDDITGSISTMMDGEQMPQITGKGEGNGGK